MNEDDLTKDERLSQFLQLEPENALLCPSVLLDSLEGIDSGRIPRGVGYFRTRADYLVVDLLPEDAAALPEEYAYVEHIE